METTLNNRSGQTEQAARRQAWASFRVAEAEGIYNEAPTVSLIQGDAAKAYPEMRIFVSCSEGRDAEFFSVNFKGKFQKGDSNG